MWGTMSPLDLVRLTALMAHSQGRPEIVIGLIDGPVSLDHPDLAADRIHVIPGTLAGACTQRESAACQHGTFVAGVLCARRGSPAPAICPECSLLVCPIFPETSPANGDMPSAKPEELAEAILDCIHAGAQVLNISAAIAQPSLKAERALQQALNEAARRGTIVVAAAGNQGILGSTAITSHSWVIPVVAYSLGGKPLGQSNFGNSIGRRGLGAPGDRITSLGAGGKPITLGGTSAAAPFVTGAIALLWSEFTNVSAGAMKLAVTRSVSPSRTSVVPPLLDAWEAYQSLLGTSERRRLA
jgi:subtilisin family serine protease